MDYGIKRAAAFVGADNAGAGGGGLLRVWAQWLPRHLAALGDKRVNPFEKDYSLPGRRGPLLMLWAGLAQPCGVRRPLPAPGDAWRVR